MCSIAPTTIVVEKRQATYCWAWCPCGWSPSCARCQQHKPAPRCRTWWVGVHIQSVQWGFQYYWFWFHLAILSTNYQHLTVLSTNYRQIIYQLLTLKKILTKSIPCFFWACLSSLLHASLIFDLRKAAWNIEDCSEANIILWFVYSSDVLEPHLGHFYPWSSQSLQNLRQNGLEKVKNTTNLPKCEIMILCPESRSHCRPDPSQQPQLSCLSQRAPPTVESFTHCAWRGGGIHHI